MFLVMCIESPQIHFDSERSENLAHSHSQSVTPQAIPRVFAESPSFS